MCLDNLQPSVICSKVSFRACINPDKFLHSATLKTKVAAPNLVCFHSPLLVKVLQEACGTALQNETGPSHYIPWFQQFLVSQPSTLTTLLVTRDIRGHLCCSGIFLPFAGSFADSGGSSG